MKTIFGFLFMLFSFSATSQVSQATLQASGLTCSMCSNSINKALKTIDYVENVRVDIKNSSFNITFKPGANVRFDDLKKKVEDAGFFIANLTATVNFSDTKISKDEHTNVGGMVLHFVHAKEQTLSGNNTIRIIDKGFVSSKEFKKNGKLTTMECYQTGTASACCSKSGISSGSRVYHVSI